MSVSKRKRDECKVSFEELVTPNFEELARRFPDFGRAYRQVQQQQKQHNSSFASNVTQDFTIALTKALLNIHFGISLACVPTDQLCPPVPNRYYFVRWMNETLLPQLSSPDHFVQSRLLSDIGLDIGTGPTCIYPLLFAASNPSYYIYATDIDHVSIQYAQQNVQANPLLSSRIKIFQVSPCQAQSPIVHGPLWTSLQAVGNNARLDFCMVNPPFYDLHEAFDNPRAGDDRERTKMAIHEGIYPGGEVGFVLDMIVDGLDLIVTGNVNPGWTSCMCGKKSSFVLLFKTLTQLLGPGHVRTSEFAGTLHSMTRWFLAWTWERPCLTSNQLEPYEFSVDNVGSVAEIHQRITTFCQETTLGNGLVVQVLTHDTFRLVESTPSLEWDGDEALPERIRSRLPTPNLRMQVWLPPEGHFGLDLRVTVTHGALFVVQAQGYCHSARGRRWLTQQLQQKLPGEITRTNRRWRRRFQQHV